MSVPFDVAYFLGPHGGLIGVAYGVGAASGWAFAVRTVLKLANRRIDEMRDDMDRRDAECTRRIMSLENVIDRLENRLDEYTQGATRQLRQVRQSSKRVLGEE